MATVTMRQLLEAGIHFGHQTRRWNPKMKRFIFGQRKGIYILDLQKTLRQLNSAYECVRDTVSAGGTVLFVGTKKQAQESVAREAQRCGMYFVNSRWLGGTLTNWQTIRQSLQRMLMLEDQDANGKLDQYSKKEGIRLRKECGRLQKNLSGIRDMTTTPNILFIIDTKKEHIAVQEARRMGMICIGVVDTNCDPDQIDIPIPGNDDALRAVSLFCSVIADAVIEGRMYRDKGGVEAMKGDARAAAVMPKVTEAEFVDKDAEAEAAGELADNTAGAADWKE